MGITQEDIMTTFNDPFITDPEKEENLRYYTAKLLEFNNLEKLSIFGKDLMKHIKSFGKSAGYFFPVGESKKFWTKYHRIQESLKNPIAPAIQAIFDAYLKLITEADTKDELSIIRDLLYQDKTLDRPLDRAKVYCLIDDKITALNNISVV
jgi:hypothetical protein